MRAEDIVGAVFFVTLLAGLGTLIYGSQKKAPAARALWHGRGFVIEGLAFVVFGSVSAVLIRTSPRQLVEGNIWGIHRSTGRSSGSRFSITTNSGAVVSVHCTYEGPGLREGDRARVNFVQYNGKLTTLELLDGSFAGWRRSESSGEGSCWTIAVFGSLCWLAAYGQLRQAKARSLAA